MEAEPVPRFWHQLSGGVPELEFLKKRSTFHFLKLRYRYVVLDHLQLLKHRVT